MAATTRLLLLLGMAVAPAAVRGQADPPPGGERARLSWSYLDPPELQFGCWGGGDDAERRYAARLAKGDLAAARELWRGHSRRSAADVLRFVAGPPPGGAEFRTFQREVEAAVRPEAVLKELKDGDYLWGTWVAFLRPHKDFVPVLLARLKDRPKELPETTLALGNSGDPRALEPLLALLQSKDYQTAGDAARALGYLGDPKAEPALIAALSSDNGWRQLRASGALANLGTAKALPALEKLANHRGYTGALNVTGLARDAVVRIERRHLPPDPGRWPDGPEAEPTTTLHGHAGDVWAVAFSPDGKALASVGDRAVRVWDPVAGAGTAAFVGNARQMTHVGFVGPGVVATAGWGDDGSVRLLDVRTGRVTLTIPADDGGVGSLTVSPDGKLIATTGSKFDKDEAVRVFDATTGKAVATLPRSTRALAFSPDGKRLAAARAEDASEIQVWDVATGKVTATLRGHTQAAQTAAFSPDGRTLVSGGDWTVRWWEVRTGKELGKVRGDSDITGVAFHPDGRRVVAAEADGLVRLWDWEGGRALAVLKAKGPVAFSPDGSLLATGADDGPALVLWDLTGQGGPRK